VADETNTTTPPGPVEPVRLPPVTGAWRQGDPVGDRRFLRLLHPFVTEGGGILDDVTVAYETWGALDATASNAVLVCHALTGDSHAAGPARPGHPTAGWWDDMIGPGLHLDTNRWFVVCVNVLGGCQGTTGPASLDPRSGRPYGSRFPTVSMRDTVRLQAEVQAHLGIGRWLGVVGGSMGGMQVLEWGVMYPDRVRSLAPLATAVAATAQQIAWSAAGRAALEVDPRFRGGDYYDAAPGDGPHAGLIAARMLAMIHYRSADEFTRRFERSTTEPRERRFRLDHTFEVERYLRYQGEQLVRRFDANTYRLLNVAMDLHDIGRDRGGVEAALRRVTVPVMTLAVSTDFLYPPSDQRRLAEQLRANGIPVSHHEIVSDVGHDGFLVETDAVGTALSEFMTGIEKGLQ
jgi:homoserine O-acetyltransferase/O-succinyltransferase